MEQLDQVIREAVEPYLHMIEDLQKKQKEKEAEIITLKFAIMEMERKFQDLEKKVKTSGGSGAAAGVGGRTTARGTKPLNQVASNAYGSTRNAGIQKKPEQNAGARQRSRTPQSSKMQSSTLNSSMNKTQLVGGVKAGGGTAQKPTVGPSSRNNSSSRNPIQSSQGLKRQVAATYQGSQKEKKLVEEVSTRTPHNQKQQSMIGTGAHTPKGSSSMNQNSRPNSRQSRDNGSVSTAQGLKSQIKQMQNEKTLKGGSNAQDTSMTAYQSGYETQERPQNEAYNGAVQATFGKVSTFVYSWENKPKRDNPALKPAQDLMKLVYVPSYNGRNCRNNLYYLDQHHIIFHASTVVVIMNVDTLEQSLLQGHTEEVQCLAVQRDCQLLCTGQKANFKEKDPLFILWDLQSMQKLAFVAYHSKLVSAVAFEERGIYLITLGGNEKMSIAIWKIKDLCDIAKKEKGQIIRGAVPLCEQIIGKIQIHSLFVDNAHSDYSMINLVMGVEKGLKFFTVKLNEKVIEEKKATLPSSSDSLKNVYAITFNGEDTIAGGDNGLIYSFRQDKVADSKFKAHTTAIQVMMHIEKDGIQYLACVSEDAILTFWDGSDMMSEHDLISQEIKQQLGIGEGSTGNGGLGKLKAKSMDYNGDGVFIVGFEQNIILKYSLKNDKRELVIASPFQNGGVNQLVALPCKPNTFATVGSDKFIRFYTYKSLIDTKKVKPSFINSVELQGSAKSLDFSPNGRFLAVGYENGVFEMFQLYENQDGFLQLECLKLFDLNRKYPISCIRFSPDGKYLVISCNKDIVLFNAQNEDFDQEGLLKGNTSAVSFLQFDVNSQYVMTNSIDCQILVFEMNSGFFKRIEPSLVKDLEWDRKCCIYQWDTIGIWGSEYKENDINSVSISQNKKYMIVGDSNGKPRLFLYPAYLPKQSYTYLEGGHLSNVSATLFAPIEENSGKTDDDLLLITAGEYDCAILIWKQFQRSVQRPNLKLSSRQISGQEEIKQAIHIETNDQANDSQLNISVSSKNYQNHQANTMEILKTDEDVIVVNNKSESQVLEDQMLDQQLAQAESELNQKKDIQEQDGNEENNKQSDIIGEQKSQDQNDHLEENQQHNEPQHQEDENLLE